MIKLRVLKVYQSDYTFLFGVVGNLLSLSLNKQFRKIRRESILRSSYIKKKEYLKKYFDLVCTCNKSMVFGEAIVLCKIYFFSCSVGVTEVKKGISLIVRSC